MRRAAGRVSAAIGLAGSVLAAVALGAGPAAGSINGGPPSQTKLCAQLSHVTVRNQWGASYIVRNDNFGGRAECLRNTQLQPNFAVTRSGASTRGNESLAFPDIYTGCSWALCTPGTTLPQQVSALRRPATSWSARTHSAGKWSAAYDIWFNKTASDAGQADGAEIMIWLDTSGFPHPRAARIVRIDHTRWYVLNWVTRHNGTHWNYIQFRRVHPASHVWRMRLQPFFRRAERMGLLDQRWYLLNIEAGFEIWSGGRGLGTTGFWARA